MPGSRSHSAEVLEAIIKTTTLSWFPNSIQWLTLFINAFFFSQLNIPNSLHSLFKSLPNQPFTPPTSQIAYFPPHKKYWDHLVQTSSLTAINLLTPFSYFLFVSKKGCLFQGLRPLGPNSINFLPPLQVPFLLIIIMLKSLNYHDPSFYPFIFLLFLPSVFPFYLLQRFLTERPLLKPVCPHLHALLTSVPWLQFPLPCGIQFC